MKVNKYIYILNLRYIDLHSINTQSTREPVQIVNLTVHYNVIINTDYKSKCSIINIYSMRPISLLIGII